MKSRRDFLKNIVFTAGIGLGVPNLAVAGYEKINPDNAGSLRRNDIPTMSISTIIEILHVDRCYDTGEIFVDCLAMDGCMDVFELTFLTGFTEKASEYLEIGSLYKFYGKYISLSADIVMVYHVELESFQPTDLFKDEAGVRKRFEEYKSKKDNILPF
ncbi:MAG: hypothetical protein CVU71_07210 [Deltaproteobacteria bacterium HGW-Deltaproteobacteria-6]|jgi:hypothetical protein|nr:MAG: hypothetical protein CVU71_07210 [Deltaproteobacteria bacterium HGW-Deltaproteobacteria-6]